MRKICPFAGTKTNMLRGANVFGKPTPVPESLVGMVVVENKQKPMDEDAARTFIQTHSFEQYVLWNEYAQAMATGENLKKALEGYCHAEEVSDTFFLNYSDILFDSILTVSRRTLSSGYSSTTPSIRLSCSCS